MNKFTFDFKNKWFSFFMRLLNCLRISAVFFTGGEKCVRCGKNSLYLPLCKNCLDVFSGETLDNFCKICGKPLISEIEICTGCRQNPVLKSTDGIFPVNSYRLWKKLLLFSWKLEEKRSLSPVFARLFFMRLLKLQERMKKTFYVVPVPPRPGKIHERGWDQIEELCFYLKNGWNVKILPILERYSKYQQKKLDRVQRLGTIGSAYGLINSKKLEKIKNKLGGKLPEEVVIADDVLTTGSTFENCGKILKSAGIKKVYGIALFVVD